VRPQLGQGWADGVRVLVAGLVGLGSSGWARRLVGPPARVGTARAAARRLGRASSGGRPLRHGPERRRG